LIGTNLTFKAIAFLTTRYQTLLREIDHVCGEDREYLSNKSISAGNVDPVFSSINKWAKQSAHAIVKELVALRGVCFVRVIIELRNRQISNQHRGVRLHLSVRALGNVSNCQVYWPGAFISSEVGKLCFIGGEDDWCNS
jgi:hypothetical protein